MRTLSRLFVLVLGSLGLTTEVQSRAPETKSEHSLLYWRYLCHGQPQEEISKTQSRELKCPKLGWSVRTPASSGEVKEIIENDSP